MLGNNSSVIDGIKSQTKHLAEIPSYVGKQFKNKYGNQSFFEKHPVISGIGVVSLFIFGLSRIFGGTKSD